MKAKVISVIMGTVVVGVFVSIYLFIDNSRTYSSSYYQPESDRLLQKIEELETKQQSLLSILANLERKIESQHEILKFGTRPEPSSAIVEQTENLNTGRINEESEVS